MYRLEHNLWIPEQHLYDAREAAAENHQYEEVREIISNAPSFDQLDHEGTLRMVCEFLRRELNPSALSRRLRARFVQEVSRLAPLGTAEHTSRQEEINAAIRQRVECVPGSNTAEDSEAFETALLDWARQHKASELDQLQNLRAEARLRSHAATPYIKMIERLLMLNRSIESSTSLKGCLNRM